MTDLDLYNPKAWEHVLGLIPVPLRAQPDASSTFVLQNGQRGNLCLDLKGRDPDAVTRSEAWSCNVGHFVSLQSDQALIQNWSSPAVERYRLSDIRADLDGFHRYLERREPHPDTSVVAHVLGVFRRLRRVLGPEVEGPRALDVLLVLLASKMNDQPIEDIDLESWALTPTALSLAEDIDELSWRELQSSIARPKGDYDLQAYLDLVLRHASGLLFQEAHFAALFSAPDQLEMPGLPAGAVAVARHPSEIGVYFTPPALARAIAEEAVQVLDLNVDQISVLDPACGSGEFLKEALRSLRRAGYKGKVRLSGMDISPAAVQMAQFGLSWEMRSDPNVDLNVVLGDSLSPETAWPESTDLVLMNPPFLSWQDMEDDARQRVKGILGVTAKYRPDIATAFVTRATEVLAEEGVLGTIVPASFLDGESTAPVRDLLSDRLHSVIHARLGSQTIFPSATVDAAFFVATRAERPMGPIAFWADHRASSVTEGLRMLRVHGATHDPDFDLALGDGVSIYRNPALGTKGDLWMPRPYEAWKALQTTQDLPHVTDRFSIHQGIRTGANPVFLLDPEEWRELPENERKYFRRAVVNASIADGQLKSETFLFYPYGERDIESEAELKEVVPQYYEAFLQPERKSLVGRSRIDEHSWWRLSEPRKAWPKEEAKIVATYFGERGSFAADLEGDHLVVQGHAWFPKKRRLTRDETTSYLALLNSRFFLRLIASTSSQVSGGQWNLSKKFLKELPLPNVRSVASDLRIQLASLGERIHSAGLSSLSREEDEAVEELVRACMGVTR